MEDYEALVRPLVEGRRIVLVGGVAAGWTATVELLGRLGSGPMLVLATEGRGSGPQPDPTVARCVASAPSGATTMLGSLRAGLEAARHPSAELLDALRSFDPAGDALVIGTFLADTPSLDGRPLLAYRWPEWVALEDKVVVDALWDRAGVPRAPSIVVPVADAARAARAHDQGAGTVWAGDAREGFNGGAAFVRWVRNQGEAEGATAFFAKHCDRVRVMGFLAGVPCSIHGIVFPDQVLAVRPVEMVTLHRPDTDDGGFFYAGCASFYDPPVAGRDELRALARRVGAVLRDEVGFRGAFTIDGVVTDAGFLPTELNPRMGAGLNTVLRALPELPLQLMLDALVGGIDLGCDPTTLEDDLVVAADANRAGGTWRLVPDVAVEPLAARPATYDSNGGAWRWSEPGDDISATVTAGESGHGSFVRCLFDEAATPVGPSVAPRAAAFWRFINADLGLGLGRVVSAADA